MEKNFWLKRWTENETGWHQPEVEPALIQWIGSREPLRVFVPLCGKSLDLLWLRDHGHEVVGVELSTKACESFFSENAIEAEQTVCGDLRMFRSKGITLFNGDIFSLTPELLGRVDTVYDRAALIALPPDLRTRYSAHLQKLILKSILSDNFEFLQIILTREPSDELGPPFSVTVSELNSLYGNIFVTSALSKEKVEAKAPLGSVTYETVLLGRTRGFWKTHFSNGSAQP